MAAEIVTALITHPRCRAVATYWFTPAKADAELRKKKLSITKTS
jgi:hypothetical protein